MPVSFKTVEDYSFETLTTLDSVRRETIPLNRLQKIKQLAPQLREQLMKSGRVKAVHQFSCSISPYPVNYGFHNTYTGIYPFLFFNNRATLVQFMKDGQLKNLLFNPIFPELSEQAGFYQILKKTMPSMIPEFLFAKRQRSIIDQLKDVGIKPEDIDYISWDHLHVQDMRPLMGTRDSTGKVIQKPLFPKAVFIWHKDEYSSVEHLHPTVGEWYVPGAIHNVITDRLCLYEKDILLGDGVALVHTPGHTPGMHTLFIHTEKGTVTFSENGVGADAYNPENSAVSGVAENARMKGWEVVMNANTLDMRFDQYNSMVLEKILAGPAANSDFCNHHPTSEFTTWYTAPGLKPTYEHGDLVIGQIKKR